MKDTANNKTKTANKSLTPLWIISLFITLTESVIGGAAFNTSGGVQVALVSFAMIFPLIIASGFFALLWFKPHVFYPPGEFANVDVEKYVGAFTQTRFTQTVKKTTDLSDDEVQVVGNPDQFKLLFKAVGSTWMKSTKAMEVDQGCVLQVTTEHRNIDGSSTAAEAVVFVPGVCIEKDEEGDGYHLCVKNTQI